MDVNEKSFFDLKYAIANFNSFSNDKLAIAYFDTPPSVADGVENINFDTVSYTMYSYLRCPIKYYNSFIKGVRTFNNGILVGIIIHKIYEKVFFKLKFDESFDVKKCFDFLTYDYIHQCINKAVEKYAVKYNLPNNEIDADEIYNIIMNSIDRNFIVNIYRKIKKYDYKLFIEMENKFEALHLFNSDIMLYTRPDLVLYNDTDIEVYDIKTGNFSKDNVTQLSFYAYNVILCSESNSMKNVRGYVFSTKFKQCRCMINCKALDIKYEVQGLISNIDNFYKENNITSSRYIKYFVERDLLKKDKESLKCIYKQLLDLYGYNLCKFCYVIDMCPFRLGKMNNEFLSFLNITDNERLFNVKVKK